MIKNIHHINFIFADLDAAVRRFEEMLGIGPFIREDLEKRGARTARCKLGDTWLVLVSPLSPDTVPGRYLAENGEGFFLISFGTDSFELAIAALEQNLDANAESILRSGVDNWMIMDLPDGSLGNINAQITCLGKS